MLNQPNAHGLTPECVARCAIRDGVVWAEVPPKARRTFWAACTPDILWRQVINELELAAESGWYGADFRPSDDFALWLVDHIRHPWVREHLAELPRIPGPVTPTQRRLNAFISRMNLVHAHIQGPNVENFFEVFETELIRWKRALCSKSLTD